MRPPFPPMEATTADEVPRGGGWHFEPKWDGFRCLAFRDGADVELQSKATKSLTRYFPDVVESVKALRPRRFVLDGELMVPADGGVSFDRLLQRIHPAESRVERLARETPAIFVLFDLLARGEKTPLVDRPREERRAALERWAERYLADVPGVALSPCTADRRTAVEWLEGLGGVDGVVAKETAAPYRSGSREGMVKVKRYRTADCVVGGFRPSKTGEGVGSLLLGLYDDDGLLHHVGHTSSFSADERVEVLSLVEPLAGGAGFTGKAPGGPSRWTGGEEREWIPLDPERVAEVRYDHVTGDRFRHGTAFQRWRPDKAPDQCTLDQIRSARGGALRALGAEEAGR